MKLKSFKIQNYKSCQKTELQLNEELTCLIGVNGSGKTNILNAIFLIKLKGYLTLFGKNIESFKQSIVNIELIDDDMKILYIRGRIIFDIDEHNKDYIQDVIFKMNFKNFIKNQNWFNIPLMDISNYSSIIQDMKERLNSKKDFFSELYMFDIKLQKVDIKSINIIEKLYILAYNFFSNINYYSASIFAEPTKCPSSVEFENNQPKIKLNSEIGHIKFIIDLFELSKKKETDFKSYLNIVNKSGIGLIDNIIFTEVPLPSQSYEVKSAENIKVKESKRLLVVPNFQIDGINLSPNQLSEGTFRTLALIFYILNDDSKLLLIEEPEVCVHHGLLSSIIELIKSQSKHKQIIISTHSDFVLDQLEPENIVLVKRDDKKGTTIKSLTKSMSRNDYKALRNYLNETGNLGEYWKEGGFDNE
ncbi:MAG: AAA family ATPase [Candidatus Kapabacteria bacterium]|nr:AAA family ATPase [Candidatus Kapabacteria bacterium]